MPGVSLWKGDSRGQEKKARIVSPHSKKKGHPN